MSKRQIVVVHLFTLVLSIMVSVSCQKKPGDDIPSADWVSSTRQSMSPRQELGQTFMLTVDPIRYFMDFAYKDVVNAQIARYQPCGIHLSSDLSSWKAEILTEFNSRKLAIEIIKMRAHFPITPIFCADYETGAWYWDSATTSFPNSMALSASRSPEMAYRQGKITSIEAKAQLIHMIFSPVINTTSYFPLAEKVRSYGSNADSVIAYASRYVQGCSESGVAPVMKYLDPSALSSEDYRTEASAIISGIIPFGSRGIMTTPLSTWGNDDVLLSLARDVFSIGAGTGHLVISPLEGVTDTLQTSANNDLILLRNAVSAGVNLVILPKYETTEIPLLDKLYLAWEKREFDIGTIEPSIMSILTLKDTIGLPDVEPQYDDLWQSGIGIGEYLDTSQRISDESLTMLKNEDAILPMDDPGMIITSIAVFDELSAYDAAIYDSRIRSLNDNVTPINVIGVPEARLKSEIMRRTPESDLVLCTVFINPRNIDDHVHEIRSMLDEIQRVNPNIVVASLGSPYLVTRLPDVKGFISTYSVSPQSINSALNAIFGTLNPSGRLPDAISADYPAGFGLSYDTNDD